MHTGAHAFAIQKQFYGTVDTHQSANGSEFQTLYVEAVKASGAKHRYSRSCKKNEQSHIEKFNKSPRRECFPRGNTHKQTSPSFSKRQTNSPYITSNDADTWGCLT